MTCDDQDRLYRLAIAVLSTTDSPINPWTIRRAILAIKTEETAIANHQCHNDFVNESMETSENAWDFSNH
jgi:hypothetical protein